MLALIYGTNQVAIRNFILRTAQEVRASAIKEYALEKDEISSIESTLQNDIFGESVLNIVDISKIVKDQLERLSNFFKLYPKANIILVSNRDLALTASVVKVVREFRGKVVSATLARPNEIFKFLDDLFSKREAQCYKNLQKLLEIDNDPVYILVMIQYQLKHIALVKYGLGKKLTTFQRSSAERQAQNFSKSRILELYELLYTYDVALKTGKILPESVALLATQKILAS